MASSSSADTLPGSVADPERLAALRATGLLTLDLEPTLDRWTRLASTLIDAPLALLSLVEADGQFFKSAVGLPDALVDRRTPLSHSFCKHVVERRAPLVVDDAHEDPVVGDNPAIAELGVVAYAGVPVTTADGHTLGAFCVIEHQARAWTADELALLEDLAAGLTTELNLRAALGRARTNEAELALQARVDTLTGLPNRRQLTEDLARSVAAGSRTVLAMFDLDGFKAYNDAFGHPAGDGLLARLGRRLATVVAEHGGRAYRLGGDEFCALLADGRGVPAASNALRETGEGFQIGASYGQVELDERVTSAEQAMNLVDQRLYEAKHRRSGVGHEVQAVLLGVLREREPELDEHVRAVGCLARDVARRLGLDAAGVDEVVAAAHLHDVGKVAIPDSILEKPGPLDAEEWAIMRRHTLFGERIIGTAPALRTVAALVRASHERWDGGGYPDGLAGADIPLGARIILACDAYHAMTAVRPYSDARPPAEAQEELRAHAGSQFDPEVVRALLEVLEEGPDAGQNARSSRVSGSFS